MTAGDDNPCEERRWHPKDNTEWSTLIRQMMFDSVRLCIARAIGAAIRGDALPQEVYSTDEVFRHLHACARSCALSLYAIGRDADGVVQTVRAAAEEAAQPDELHPAVIRAIEQWCREANPS